MTPRAKERIASVLSFIGVAICIAAGLYVLGAFLQAAVHGWDAGNMP